MIMLAKIINNLTIYPLIRSNNIAVIQFFLYCCFVIFFSPFLYHNCHTNMPQNKQMMSWRYHSRHNLTRIILMEITMVGKVIFNTFNESYILYYGVKISNIQTKLYNFLFSGSDGGEE